MVATICRRESIHPTLFYKWSKEFLEAGKRRLAGGGVVLSGVFPLLDGRKFRHVVSPAGTLEEDGQIVGVIIDDPFGDWRTDYKNCRGNDVEMNLEEFARIFRPCGEKCVKWIHLVA